jgi:hypothetical protein
MSLNKTQLKEFEKLLNDRKTEITADLSDF